MIGSVQSHGQTDYCHFRCFAIYGLVPAVCLVVKLSTQEYSLCVQSMCMFKSQYQYQPSRQYSILGERTRLLLPLLCRGLSTLCDQIILHSLFVALLPMVEYLKDFLLLNLRFGVHKAKVL